VEIISLLFQARASLVEFRCLPPVAALPFSSSGGLDEPFLLLSGVFFRTHFRREVFLPPPWSPPFWRPCLFFRVIDRPLLFWRYSSRQASHFDPLYFALCVTVCLRRRSHLLIPPQGARTWRGITPGSFLGGVFSFHSCSQAGDLSGVDLGLDNLFPFDEGPL